MSRLENTALPPELYQQIRGILHAARQQSYRAVNTAMVEAYWQIGRRIVEHEQGGEARAAYGQGVLAALAARLTEDFGKGFTTANLRNFRQFYLTFSDEQIRYALRSNLTWTHLRQLMRIDNLDARNWYMNEASQQGWSARALDRQIATLYYERLLSSQDKAALRQEASSLIAAQTPADPRDFIRDPYILEFIDAQPGAALFESELETGLIQQLQAFLLELGKGFAFVARQKHLRVENEDCFIDLVFYNYLLKCFVLIDLKIGKLAHQDVGQMDMYVRVFEEQYRAEGDNPTLGLILCSERNEAVAKYSLLADSQQLFASRYRPFLPSEAELQAELQRDRALLENQREAQA
ncbi:MAG: PDDEXK nuclease domain-containing protein [Zoogloea sp.]|uniref:PDDEXK nuclease domain-containing protein n=1 Tax=Zoogloea sp. TaxID=49181 RepID=UPI0026246356|nr:PDDEXK nuclease domain-containing protein [Zoogloea sp.]MDD2989500.1 PDDEXK nuclease domain-containing protein [Zoogloea sp.]